jgi:uncharacterized membrane protein
VWHTTHINSDERKKLFKKGASAEGQADVLLMGNIKLVLLVFQVYMQLVTFFFIGCHYFRMKLIVGSKNFSHVISESGHFLEQQV